MKKRERYLNKIQSDGKVSVSVLARKYNVSESTIRRDLTSLENSGFIKRTHGGAILQGAANKDYFYNEKKNFYLSEKKEMARVAASLVRPGSTIFLGTSTTTNLMAQRLTSANLTVVTNSLAVADELAGCEGITLVLTGGIYRADEEAFVSDIATLIFSKINVDTFFLTTCGISVERGITYQRMDEIIVQNKMMEAADQTVVIADSSKLGVNSLVKMCGIDQVSMIITDSGASVDQIRAFENAGVKVVISKERND